MAGYGSMMGMMGQRSTAPIPTQSFNSANFIGTPIPAVGDSRGSSNYANAVGGISNIQVVLVACSLIGLGYLLYHFNFEK